MSLNLDEYEFPPEFDVAALERGHAAMKQIVPEMSKVRLVVTSEFEETVQEYSGAGGDAPAYEQDRGELGVAMGKVIRLSGDKIAVIIDSGVLVAGQEHGVPERTFKHEAYHVALHQRGESLYDERAVDDEAGLAERQYLGMAAIACEESRVEMPSRLRVVSIAPRVR